MIQWISSERTIFLKQKSYSRDVGSEDVFPSTVDGSRVEAKKNSVERMASSLCLAASMDTF